MYACQEQRSRRIVCIGRTDESSWVAFTRFGARTNVTYGLNVGSRKAKLVTFEYDDAVLDVKAQRWCLASVRVVIRVLYELEEKVSLFVVKIVGQPAQEGEKVESRRGWKRMKGVRVEDE